MILNWEVELLDKSFCEKEYLDVEGIGLERFQELFNGSGRPRFKELFKSGRPRFKELFKSHLPRFQELFKSASAFEVEWLSILLFELVMVSSAGLTVALVLCRLPLIRRSAIFFIYQWVVTCLNYTHQICLTKRDEIQMIWISLYFLPVIVWN